MKTLHYTDRLAAFAQNYPSYGRLRIDADPARNGQVKTKAPALNYAKPYLLSHFQQGQCQYIVSGTMQVLAASNMPYLGILTADTVPNEPATYHTEGDFYLPLHKTVSVGRYSSEAWVGQTAYLVTTGDDWGITNDKDAIGAIAVGTFKKGWDFRQNGIMWGSRFVHVTLQPSLRTMNNPVTVTPASTTSGCCFSNCVVEAYPEVKAAHGKYVEIDINPFSANPAFEVFRVELNYTGITETIIVDGLPVVQPKTDDFNTTGSFAIPFADYATGVRITARVFVSSIEEGGCSCSNGGCCETFTFTIDVVANSGYVCTPAPEPAPLNKDWQLFRAFKDTKVLIDDVASEMTIGTTVYSFTAPVSFSDTSVLESEISAVLTGEGFIFGSVTVSYAAAAVDGETATLSITITNLDSAATPKKLGVSIDANPLEQWYFAQIG